MWWSLWLACGGPRTGTSVGNPNLTLLKIAPGGPGVALQLASATVDQLVIDEQVEDGPGEVDLLVGAELEVPAGQIQSLEIRLQGRILLLGSDGADALDLELEVPAIGVSLSRQPLEPDVPHVFELASPGWLLPEAVGWVPGADHVVRPGDPEHQALVLSLIESSAVYPDADADGSPER